MKLKHCLVSAMLYQSQSALHGMCNAVWDGFKMADEWLMYGEAAAVVGFHPVICLHGIQCEEEEKLTLYN